MMSVCAAELVHPSSVSPSFVFRNAVKSKSMITLLQFLVRMLRCWFKWRGQLLSRPYLWPSHPTVLFMAWLGFDGICVQCWRRRNRGHVPVLLRFSTSGSRPRRTCRYFSEGQCNMASSCTFAHNVHELHSESPPMGVCMSFGSGSVLECNDELWVAGLDPKFDVYYCDVASGIS